MGYGDAIVLEQAKAFVEACTDEWGIGNEMRETKQQQQQQQDPAPATHPWQDIRVLCRNGLRGYDRDGRQDWMLQPNTWLAVTKESQEISMVTGQQETYHYMAVLPGQGDAKRAKYEPVTRCLYTATDLWELWRMDEVAVLGVGGVEGLYGEDEVSTQVELWWVDGADEETV